MARRLPAPVVAHPRIHIRGAFDVFGGAEKSLKSWLMHHFAIAVAAGSPSSTTPDARHPPGDVLLLTGEGGVTSS